MKRHHLFLLGLVLAASILYGSVVRAAQDFSKGLLNREAVMKVAAKITHEKYPNSDDVLVDDYIHVRYEKDGTSETWDDTFVKVLTEKGKRQNKTLSFGFTLPYGTVDVPLLEVIKPDGRVVTVNVKKESRVMIDPSQMRSNIYNPNSKVLRISIPELEIGDVVRYLAHHRIVKPRMPNTWCDIQVFEYTSPIKHYIYEVNGPKALPLRRIALKDEIKGTVSSTKKEEGDRIVYRWEVRDVPRMFPEPKMPALYTVVQRLLVSTIPDWQTISKWYWNLSAPHYKPTPAMKAKVNELIQGKKTRKEKIGAIFHWVSHEIRYLGVTVEKEAPGYEPHDVSMTFERRHGVCRDKAALLVEMLRLAGFKAYPVLIHVGPKKDKEVPNPYFNHAISCVQNDDGSYTLMDSTDENTKDLMPKYLCNRSYLVAKPAGDDLRVSPVIPADRNLVRISMDGTVDSRGDLEGTCKIRFDGINDNAYRGYFARIKPNERKQFFERALKATIPDVKLTYFRLLPENIQDPSLPLSVELGFEAKDVVVSNDTIVLFPAPRLGSRIGVANFIIGQTGLKKRKYPLIIDSTCGVKEKIVLKISPSLGRPIGLKKRPPIDAKVIRWGLQNSFDQKKREFIVDGEFMINVVEFSPKQYLALRKARREIEKQSLITPVFTRDPKQAIIDDDSSVLILENYAEYALKDAHNWSEYHRVKKLVLTYDGKKKNGELKIHYNPAWEDVKLISASVTNGAKREEASDQEINLMDAPWVGGAPRYPGEKVLVVSLPGVEVGSVIAYEFIISKKNHPSFSLAYSFAGFDPSVRRTLKVIAPKSLKLQIEADQDGFATEPPLEEMIEGKFPHVFDENVSAEGDSIMYVWTAKNQRGMKRESMLPPLWSFTPTVAVKAGSWKGSAKRLRGVLLAAAKGQGKAEAKAKELTKGLKNAEAKIVAIRDFVAKNIRAAGPSVHAVPLSAVTPADRTLQDGYGNSADRAVLLYAMLKAARLSPELVLASHGPREPSLREIVGKIGGVTWLPDVLVRVKTREGRVYLNDTNQYAVLGVTAHEDGPCLNLDNGRLGVIKALKGKETLVKTTIRCRFEDSGKCDQEQVTRFYGVAYMNSRRKFAEMPPEERRRYYQELVSGVSQTAKAKSDLVTNFESYPGVEKFEVEIGAGLIEAGPYKSARVPFALAGILGGMTDTRSNPVYWPGPVRRDVHVTIVLPDAWREVVLRPATFEWKAPNGAGYIRTTFLKDEKRAGVWHFAQEADLKPALISVQDYGKLLEAFQLIRHRKAHTLLLARTKGAKAKASAK